MVMAKEKFLMVSLEDNQAKQLAEVLSNDTSRKIINYLSEHEDVTETHLAEILNIPLPTVHYNLQKLKEAQLVGVEEFHYSKIGKEVNHYKLANKYVIITPKPVKGIKTQLRHILPAVLGIAGVSAILYLVKSRFVSYTQPVMESAKSIAVERAAEAAETAAGPASFAMQSAQDAASEALQKTVQYGSEPNIALWFLIGGLSALAIYIAINLIWRSRR